MVCRFKANVSLGNADPRDVFKLEVVNSLDSESNTIKCPRCGEKGLLTTMKTITKKGKKKHV